MGKVCGCQIMGGPLDVEAMRRSVEDLAHGEVVTYFHEVVGGIKTYQADEERALFAMFAVAEEVAGRWDANITIAQRLGELMPGEVTLVIAVAGDSRERAFAGCRFAAERLGESQTD